MSLIVRKFKKINKKLIKIKFCYNPTDIFYEIYNIFFYNFFVYIIDYFVKAPPILKSNPKKKT